MEKETLKFKIARKVITYEGYVSRRAKDLMEILAKLNVNEDTVIPTFRENIEGENQFTDEEIMNEYRAALKLIEENNFKVDEDNINNTFSNKTNNYWTVEREEPETNQKHLYGEASYVNEKYEDGSRYNPQLSVRERDELNNFIEEVLRQPLPDVGAYLRKDSELLNENSFDDSVLPLTARTLGKIQVYCQDERGGSTKLIYATPQMSFDEFAAIVEKKYGCPMAMSFYEGDDVIELDDDDVLAMFLEMCSQGGKKVKLIVGDFNTRKRATDDELTANKLISVNASNSTSANSSTNQQAVAYSNGELKVTLQRTYTGHTLAVYCCAFSSNGEQFVTASRDRSVRL